VNAHYVAGLSDEEFVRWASPFIAAAGVTLDGENAERLKRAAPFLKTRCATLADAPDAAAFLFLERPLTIEGKTAKPLEKEGARDVLREVGDALADASAWASPALLDEKLQAFAAARNVGFGIVGPPARAALTAGRPSPGLGEVLYGLGRKEALARLADQAS